MVSWSNDLLLSGFPWFLDAKNPRDLSFISHAHSDHIAPHAKALLTPATFQLTEARTVLGSTVLAEYHQPVELGPDLVATLLPAGHVLGSAMLLAQSDKGRFLYTGDFKLRPGLTCPPAEPTEADELLMECTYGLPFFKFPPAAETHERLVTAVQAALADGRQPFVLGYALGKAQEITRILTRAGIRVTVHGAVARLNAAYESLGVPLGPWRRYAREDFHGPKAIPLEERGVLIAPPNCARAPFMTSFPHRYSAVMSGWGLEKNAKYRYGVDDVFPLSDHADHTELLETIDRVRPKVIWLHHGYTREFGEELRAKGLDARPAEPEAQLQLFS